MSYWKTAREAGGSWFVEEVDEGHRVLHRHPIPFESEREASRAAKRLTARDEQRVLAGDGGRADRHE